MELVQGGVHTGLQAKEVVQNFKLAESTQDFKPGVH